LLEARECGFSAADMLVAQEAERAAEPIQPCRSTVVIRGRKFGGIWRPSVNTMRPERVLPEWVVVLTGIRGRIARTPCHLRLNTAKRCRRKIQPIDKAHQGC
jgi:hypothetical protein